MIFIHIILYSYTYQSLFTCIFTYISYMNIHTPLTIHMYFYLYSVTWIYTHLYLFTDISTNKPVYSQPLSFFLSQLVYLPLFFSLSLHLPLPLSPSLLFSHLGTKMNCWHFSLLSSIFFSLFLTSFSPSYSSFLSDFLASISIQILIYLYQAFL